MPDTSKEPPLITVTNPVTYFRRWWEKVMGKEGIDLRFTIHPVTAFLIAFGFGIAAFGVGRYSVKIPFLGLEVVSSPTPKSDAETWKETAYIGTLKYSPETNKYFLVTSTASEAITLEVPSNINLGALVEKRIMVIGKYSKSLRVIEVMDAKDMEILPKSPNPVPTNTPSFESEKTDRPTIQPTSEDVTNNPKPQITPSIPPPID